MSLESERFRIERYRQDLFHLTNLARRDLQSFLYEVRDLPIAEVRDLLIQVMPELVDPYLSASGELAATWYESLRADVASQPFYATSTTSSVQTSQANAIARWGVAPLVDGDATAMLTRIGGAVQRIIFDGARGVVEGNVVRDPVRVGYQRMARPGCCAFCGMLASRGAVYRSAETAGSVVGRGATRTGFDAAGNRLAGGIGQGVRARGAMSLGDNYHDHCYCVVMPVFVGSEMAELASADRDRWLEMYQQASGSTQGEVLSNWRAEHGTH